MKKIKVSLLILLAGLALSFSSCFDDSDDSISDNGGGGGVVQSSKLVVVNNSGYKMLSIYIRQSGTTSWGTNYLPYAGLANGSTFTINDIPFGTYDLHSYCYGNYYQYSKKFDNTDGLVWNFTSKSMLNDSNKSIEKIFMNDTSDFQDFSTEY